MSLVIEYLRHILIRQALRLLLNIKQLQMLNTIQKEKGELKPLLKLHQLVLLAVAAAQNHLVVAVVAALKKIKRKHPMKQNVTMLLSNSSIVYLLNMIDYLQQKTAPMVQINLKLLIRKSPNFKSKKRCKSVILMKQSAIINKIVLQLPSMALYLMLMVLSLIMMLLCRSSQIYLMHHLLMKPKKLIMYLKKLSINMKKHQLLNSKSLVIYQISNMKLYLLSQKKLLIKLNTKLRLKRINLIILSVV